ncbi:hypothetical protein [Undibacter mobilis]|uniref:Uncharacterized protein n=1 Tax=Undibacter mobilis TaxID=2292256 RepID=A0A371B6R0_9BRAD|nr:hypothetical protein [Undibacter mobilis]RDV03133.1 hypothetical protein DXH78_00135 [Undibacter mobilis]
MRAALVLFEGLPPTVIDSQVLAHVRLVREVLGIDITVVAVACSQGLFEQSNARLARAKDIAGGEVVLLRGVRPAMPGSQLVNRLLLGRALAALGPLAFVQARADYAAATAGPWARQQSVPMLWDCRGDSRAELVERRGDTLSGRYRSWFLEREYRTAGATCAGALFVTTQLRDLMTPYLSGQPSWVIPCLAPEGEFFFDAALRERVRSGLGIATDEIVYIYSGSLTGYQLFDETVAAFRGALASGAKARLIVLTPDVDKAVAACADLPAGSVIARAVPHADVNGYLNASDGGMLLRDSTPVNTVAFPTKFAEYAMTGLQIVMKDAPPACVTVARELGTRLSVGQFLAIASAAERASNAKRAAERLGRRAALPTYASIYEGLARAALTMPARNTASAEA